MKTFAISLYVRTDRVDSEGRVPVFMRITVDGRRANIALNRKLSKNKWDNGHVLGNTTEAKELRNYMHSLVVKVEAIRRDLLDRGEHVSAGILKAILQGNDNRSKTLLDVFEQHNKKIKSLIGKGYSERTAIRYETTKKHVFDFMQIRYKKADIPLKELKYEFVKDFENYLKIQRNCNHNTAVKYIKNFRKVINMAVDYEYIVRDPFAKYKTRLKPVEREFLTQEDLTALTEKEFSIPRLDQVRDVFLFCCYTGLAFVDVAALSTENIIKGSDGELWIKVFRKKTESKSMIPLLPISMSILEKYTFEEKKKGEKLLPVLTNQKMNAYLKEIADVCGINKTLTSHLG
ncbi:MAG: site-specific integrase, partial [Bacteroidota bacterium]